MKYKIARAAMSLPGSIDLTPEEYATIRQAKRRLVLVLGIEEKFDLVLENYAEYERSLLELTLHQMLYRDLDWSSFRTDIQLVNRRLANLLSAARLYLDQSGHDLVAMYGSDSEVANGVRVERNCQYDTKLGYRVMEAVRNCAQHRSLPVHRMSYPSRVEQPGVPQSKLRFGIIPSLDTARLDEDGEIKPRILDELKQRGTYVPLTPLVREYVDGLGRVQETLRAKTTVDVARWEAVLTRVEERAKEALEGSLHALSVVAEDDEGIWREIDHIFTDLCERRRALSRKNGGLDRLSQRYVSGSVDECDA